MSKRTSSENENSTKAEPRTLQDRLKQTIVKLIRLAPNIGRTLLVVSTAVVIPLLFPTAGTSEHYDYAENGYWRNSDLFAPFDFNVIRPKEDIQKEDALARQNLLLYYTADSTAYGQAMQRFDAVVHRHSELNPRVLQRTIDSIYAVGYIQTPEDIPDINNRTIILLKGNIGSEHAASEYVSTLDISNSLLRDSILVPNIVYDANRTQLELDSRRSQLTAASELVHQGDLIVAKGQSITPDISQKIKSLEAENDIRYQSDYHPFGRYIGRVFLCLFAFLALFLFMKNTQHTILKNRNNINCLIATVLLFSIITALIVRHDPSLVLIVPLCIVPIIMRSFFDMRVAFYVHVTTIVILANMVPNPFEFIFYQLIAGMMSIVVVRNLESRGKYVLVSLVIFATYSLIYTFGVLSQESTLAAITPDRYLTFLINAVLTLLAHPIIYIFERIFKLTSSGTLLELTYTSHPALRALSRNAPGTFNHSMQVSNISEDLITEIGGDALLAKVGALYHDIGKIKNPRYFTENQTNGYNPHNDLDYTESAKIIIQHVQDGNDMATEYKLPEVIRDFIRSHHGTTYTGYFYAKQKAEHPDEIIDESKFRYKGPIPTKRETAVVMIVDSVEAACKSMPNATKEDIERKIDNIIDGKINEGQLQKSDLTFGDINDIRKFLKGKMVAINHARISYPVTNK